MILFLFRDKDGPLSLSETQRKKLKSWMRPDDFMDEPKVIDRIDSGTIKQVRQDSQSFPCYFIGLPYQLQTIITDCSFIASLAVCARFENRFGTRLITKLSFIYTHPMIILDHTFSIIYPQNKKNQPIHNPCGKYMIKLHINGIWRKVIKGQYHFAELEF